MESLSICLGASPPSLNPCKNPKNKTPRTHSNCIRICKLPQKPQTTTISPHNLSQNLSFLNSHKLSLKPQFAFPFFGFTFPVSCFAIETTTTLSAEEAPGRISLESILVSIDNFFTRYPFFVATVVFIWLVAIPLVEEYSQKYKFISAINAFKKLQDDPTAQLLDIRDDKSVASLGSPNLKILSKNAVQVSFREADEQGFVKRVLDNFGEPANTTLCILDNFDGNSIKVAELLVKTGGFKEAYAIRGGTMGKQGWQEIQETLLPPSVHIIPRKRTKVPKKQDTNGDIPRVKENTDSPASKEIKNEDVTSVVKSEGSPSKPLSPYPNEINQHGGKSFSDP
ncbi:rhodanese-like domain-containing protein 4A, chloroplastic isoform X2 [Salvia splendens]|uniref:rhodanese-like domain-containing protein 4A, chloroplastic isoform X2 n=1 Tax=Salvia splendens TaxID=180675 RepID=UPI001C2790AC|nr:rhodanese-like domain-containing protein 4A, chloroplastic isoform X2 [Salvia splendens]